MALANRGWPAATMNAVVQALIPPPKYDVTKLVHGVQLCPEAQLAGLVVIERASDDVTRTLAGDEAIDILMDNCDDAYGFPPYPLIAESLYTRGGVDLRIAERSAVEGALAGAPSTLLRSTSMDWWQRVPALMTIDPGEEQPAARAVAGRPAARGRGRGAPSVSSLAAGGIRPALARAVRARQGVAGGALLVVSASVTGAALAVAGARVLHAPALVAIVVLGSAAAGAAAAFALPLKLRETPKRVDGTRPARRARARRRQALADGGDPARHRDRRARRAALALQRRRLQQRRGGLRRPGRGARARSRSSPRTSRSSARTRCSSSRSSRSATSSTRATGSDGQPRSGSACSACWPPSSSGACSTASASGLIAAAVLALMPYHVIVSRQILLDGPQTLLHDHHAVPPHPLRALRPRGLALRGGGGNGPLGAREGAERDLLRCGLRLLRARAGDSRGAARAPAVARRARDHDRSLPARPRCCRARRVRAAASSRGS